MTPSRQIDRGLALAAAWTAAALVGPLYLAFYGRLHAFGFDSRAYWLTAHRDSLYDSTRVSGAFHYAPAFAQVVHPLALLPWPVFAIAWAAAETCAFGWLLRPLGWSWGIPAFVLLCVPEVVFGNVVGFVSVTTTLAVSGRASYAAAFPVLTKITPGVVSLAWLAVRRDLRGVLLAMTTTAAVAAISVALDPGAWRAWISFLMHTHSGWALQGRTAIGLALVVWGAAKRHWWTVPFGLVLVTPVLGGFMPAAYLAMLPRLWQLRCRDETDAQSRRSPPAMGQAPESSDATRTLDW